jgi:cell division protein ZapA
VAQVNVSINGRQYRMACEDGQEDHLRSLAKALEDRIGSLRGQFGEIGDARLMVMAAMTVADDAIEAEKKTRKLEQEVASLRDARSASAKQAHAREMALIAAFTSAAERVEGMAKKLNAVSTTTDEPSAG